MVFGASNSTQHHAALVKPELSHAKPIAQNDARIAFGSHLDRCGSDALKPPPCLETKRILSEIPQRASRARSTPDHYASLSNNRGESQ